MLQNVQYIKWNKSTVVYFVICRWRSMLYTISALLRLFSVLDCSCRANGRAPVLPGRGDLSYAQGPHARCEKNF